MSGAKKRKYLRKEEAKRLLDTLELNNTVNMDYLIMMIKTGLRFSEALAVTPEDFDFEAMKLTVNKAWDYKNGSDFVPTKNQCIRTISIDKKLSMQMSELIKNISQNVPIFVPGEKVCNSTYINFLAQKCKQADIPAVGLHTLRHTHAFILLDEGVTIASVLKRLGRSSMIITQNISCPVAAELEVRDNDIIINVMNSL